MITFEQYCAGHCSTDSPTSFNSPLKTLALKYVREIVNCRWPEVEHLISEGDWQSYQYATWIGERFPQGEAVILPSAQYAFYYARDVIQERWPEVEPSILNSKHALLYLHTFEISKEVLTAALANPIVINELEIYADHVKHFFKDNTVMINKWLRYADNIRTLGE
jgi:hypothetical protein